MDEILQYLYWGAIACFVCFLLVAIILLWMVRFAKGALGRLFIGDVNVLLEDDRKLGERNPDLSADERLRHVIAKQAWLAGMIGFVTGFGGLPMLAVAMPVDLVATMRIQSRLIDYLALKRGHSTSGELYRLKAYALIAGTQQINRLGTHFVFRIGAKYAPKILLKSVPIAGGIIGFLIDWTSTRIVGRAALKTLPEIPGK